MPRAVIASRLRDRVQDSEKGAIAIVTALLASSLLVIAGMVVDFGLIRVDRQVHKSAADAAVTAGIYGLDQGDSSPHPYAGVCSAARFLKRNDDRFSAIDPDAAAGWANGNGAATASGCDATSPLRAVVCDPADQTTWAKFSWAGTIDGQPIDIVIQSGYVITGSGFDEETLTASLGDTDDGASGCNHLAVIIKHERQPGFGSLATDANLVTRVRTVGRVKSAPGGYAPAMLILKRTGCPALYTGSSSADTSWIHVFGAQSSNGLSQPGTIHVDSSGAGCSHPDSILMGRQANGIVTYAAPLVGFTTADPSKPGQITTVAGSLGVTAVRIYDALANVYGASGLGPASPGTKAAPTGRGLITRRPVDERYRIGVQGMRGAANSVFADAPTSASYKRFPATVSDPCKPTQADVDALTLTATDQLYIACSGGQPFKGSGAIQINAKVVVFGGFVAPDAALTMPNATGVYIAGKSGKDALSLSGGTTGFQMHTSGNVDATTGKCTTAPSSSKSVFVVKEGAIEIGNNSTFRLCRTTVLMMGGQTTACIPATDGTAPTATPCGSGIGTGQVNQSSDATVDWVAPSVHDVTTLPDGSPDPTKAAAWSDPTGPEDLALWTESAFSTSVTSRLGGGGIFQVRGVFMLPNMKLLLGGGAALDLRDAQFISESVNLNGSGSKIDMRVDPNSAVTLPQLDVVGLVR